MFTNLWNAQHIFAPCHGLKVRWINAARDTTKVINVIAGWNWAMTEGVYPPMSVSGMKPVRIIWSSFTPLPIACVGDAPCPEPTAGSCIAINMLHEAFDLWVDVSLRLVCEALDLWVARLHNSTSDMFFVSL